MNTLQPNASIIIPCYNQSQFLKECISSVIVQGINEWEVVVVDDASSDGNAVVAIVEGFHDERIKLVKHKVNLGLASARNTGVRNSSSPIIVPLDADDRLMPNYLEVVLENIRKPENAFVYFDLQYFGAINNKLRLSRPFDLSVLINEKQYIPGISPVKRSVWEKCGGWCEEPIFRKSDEDLDFLFCVVEKGFIGTYISKPLYEYRIHSDSMTSRPRTFVLGIYRRLYKRHYSLINRYSSYLDWMAKGWLEFSRAYLQIKKPIPALIGGFWVFITSKYWRSQGAKIIRSSLFMIADKISLSALTIRSS